MIYVGTLPVGGERPSGTLQHDDDGERFAVMHLDGARHATLNLGALGSAEQIAYLRSLIGVAFDLVDRLEKSDA